MCFIACKQDQPEWAGIVDEWTDLVLPGARETLRQVEGQLQAEGRAAAASREANCLRVLLFLGRKLWQTVVFKMQV